MQDLILKFDLHVRVFNMLVDICHNCEVFIFPWRSL